MQGPICVEDVLKRPIFSGAQIISGNSGLQRVVRWVHILEVADPRDMIHGGELVLTTGVGLKGNCRMLEAYVDQLISGGAAGLCIELGTAFRQIPDGFTKKRRESDFPIIAFPSQVRFVDITQDIHGLILSRHHRILDDLEDLNRHLHDYVMGSSNLRRVLEFIRDTVGRTVIYGHTGAEPVVVGIAHVDRVQLRAQWTQLVAMSPDIKHHRGAIEIPSQFTVLRQYGSTIVSQPIVVLGAIRGSLHVICPGEISHVDEQISLVLDRAASALAHEEFRRLSVQERQLSQEHDDVERLVRGASDAASSLQALGLQRDTSRKLSVAILCSQSQASPQERTPSGWLNYRIDIAMAIRLAVTGSNLLCALAVRQNEVVILLSHATDSHWKLDFKKSVRRLMETLARSELNHGKLVLTVGDSVNSPNQIPTSYRQAKRMATHGDITSDASSAVVYYDDMGIYRWLWLAQENPESSEIAKRDLVKIEQYDREHHTELAHTLKIYLDYDRSKQRTAEHLFIHRQTLYHRLRQLEKLVGGELDDPIQRLSMHLALYSRQKLRTGPRTCT